MVVAILTGGLDEGARAHVRAKIVPVALATAVQRLAMKYRVV
jgi:hypothetical protein